MRILMRNTAVKTAAIFLFILALGGIFSGITTSVHATTAGEVGTDETKLKEFVEAAVDEYYIEFLLQGEAEHCDLTKLDLPQLAIDALPAFLGQYGISDLSPESMRTLSTEQVKDLIGLFNSPTVQSLLGGVELDIWGTCDFPDDSSFREVFGSEEGDWRSGAIYLFVSRFMDQAPQQAIIYHGADTSIENRELTGLQDGEERLIMDLGEEAADGPVQGRTEKGFYHYCWDDPTVEDDDIENPGPLEATGDSWKISYVVDPFDYLEIDGPADSPRVIFGSGIYPKTGTPPSGCRIVTDGNMEEPMDDEPGDVTDGVDDVVDSISGGGGCAITAGSDSADRNEAFNLLLIVSGLLLAVSFGNRAVGRRNGNNS